MTAFLKLNGVTMQVADRSARSTPEPVGSSLRAVDGSAVRDWRTVKKTWDAQLVLQASDAARAARQLLLAEHEVWSFEGNNLYGAKGLPLTGLGAGVQVVATQAKFGTRSLEVPDTKGFDADFANMGWTPSAKPWSVAWFQRESTTWFHYVETSAGGKWKDGATSGHAAFWTASGSKLTYLQSSGATVYLDDIVTHRFVVPNGWPTELKDVTLATPDSPSLRAEGLLIENNLTGGVTVLAEVQSDPMVQAAVAGANVPNYQSVSFRLLEV